MSRSLAALLIIFVALPAHAGLCLQWEAAKSVGTLSPKDVREASGMTVSKLVKDRVYWINDSGDKGFVYYSDAAGKDMRKVKIADYTPRDTEAIAAVDCDEGPCLALGDIGDNLSKRKNIKITFVSEQKEFTGDLKVLRTLTLEYPDGAHDAESLVILPNGDLLVITKEIHLKRLDVSNAQVFGLLKSEWSGAGDKSLKLKKLGELPLPKWLSEDLFYAQAATDAAVNTQRQTLGILTYGKAIEIPLKNLGDLTNSANWKTNVDYAVVPITAPLAQQESLTYLPQPDRMLWSTEYRMPEAPIFSMTCVRSAP